MTVCPESFSTWVLGYILLHINSFPLIASVWFCLLNIMWDSSLSICSSFFFCMVIFYCIKTPQFIILLLMSILVCSGCHKRIPQTGGLSNRMYFITVLEDGSLKIKLWSGFIAFQVHLGLHMAISLLCPHIVFPLVSLPLLIEAPVLWDEGFTHMTSCN